MGHGHVIEASRKKPLATPAANTVEVMVAGLKVIM
jgi:hypothetical protein